MTSCFKIFCEWANKINSYLILCHICPSHNSFSDGPGCRSVVCYILSLLMTTVANRQVSIAWHDLLLTITEEVSNVKHVWAVAVAECHKRQQSWQLNDLSHMLVSKIKFKQQCVVIDHSQYFATWEVAHPVPNYKIICRYVPREGLQ